MPRKDVQNISLKKSAKLNLDANKPSFVTAESITLKSTYSANDLKKIEHLNFGAGIPPFLRGPYSTMYVSDHGPLDSMPVFQLLRTVMPFTEEIWPLGKKDYLLRLI
jgi:methylmalonyl-CoA mutase N-terminal domain/subunit